MQRAASDGSTSTLPSSEAVVSINSRMRVSQLLKQHPEAQSVFDDYGIDISDGNRSMRLTVLCKEEAINYWELKSDIATAEGWDGAGPSFTEGEEDEEEEWDGDDDGDDDDDSDDAGGDDWDE
jgi:hypothetical protein